MTMNFEHVDRTDIPLWVVCYLNRCVTSQERGIYGWFHCETANP
jgi:hypothetical protein